MNNIENIFNEALEMLAKGSSVEEVLGQWPEYREQLLPLLTTALPLYELPKNAVPEPVMQKKFMLESVKKLWFAWLPFSKVAATSLSLILIITALAGTGYAALKAVPGEALFSLKKSVEHLQLKLA